MAIEQSKLVTFVTPTLNAAATLTDTISSVQREASGISYEHIFVDGGSSDDTLAMIDRLCGANGRVVQVPKRGPYDAMNKGIEVAKGKWIAIINSDDYYLPEVRELLKCIQQDEEVAEVVYGDMLVGDDTTHYTVKPGMGWRGRVGRIHPICHPAMFVKSNVYQQLGVYNTDYRMAADQEFFFRLFDARRSTKYLPLAITYMRLGGLSGRHYDEGTLELLKIHKGRRGLVGLLSYSLFFTMHRMRSHPNSPRGISYGLWAIKQIGRQTFSGSWL